MKYNHCYVIHYTKLISRKNFLDVQLSTVGLQGNYITEFDQEDLTPQIVDQFYEKNPQIHDSKIEKLWDPSIHTYRELKIPEISCTIKHFEALRLIAENQEDYGLILEDDVVFREGFVEEFDRCLSLTPNDWDAIFIGAGCGESFQRHKLSESEKVNEHCFLVDHPATNCAEAYLVKKEMADKIYKSAQPFHLISDWELAYQLFKFNAKVYWWAPSLIEQGSKNGRYESTLDLGQRR